jgi:hypothetical protein
VILGFYAGKSHNLIGLGIFDGDLDFFDLHEKSLDLSNYEIFPHKILKSRTFKKSSILIVSIRSYPHNSCCASPKNKYLTNKEEQGCHSPELTNKVMRSRHLAAATNGIKRSRRLAVPINNAVGSFWHFSKLEEPGHP